MTVINKLTLAAAFGIAALALLVSSASARIVCNEDGDCWHNNATYEYRPDFGVTIHPDDWKWKDGEHHAWREHDGRGYWRRNEWKDF
jgi:hypothetical protein